MGNQQKVAKRRRYSIIEKRGCVTCYLITGSLTKAANEVGVERQTVYKWAKTDWWQAMEDDVTAELGKKLTGRMRGVALKAYDQIDERLQNGDVRVVVGKDGTEVVRHEANLKDLTLVATKTVDKVRLGEGKATSRSENITLDGAAAAFERIAEQYMTRIEHNMSGARPVIEGEVATARLPGDK